MPVYHSQHNSSSAPIICGAALLPLRTKFNGPAPAPPMGSEEPFEDIVDEALKSFRWNIFFKNFEVQGSADKVLVYITLWIQKCLLTASQSSGMQDAKNQLERLATADIAVPGSPNFILAPFFTDPKNPQEANCFKDYSKQLRQETLARLLPMLYPNGTPNKWWFQFCKKKFMNVAL
mmetsp:Transcript_41473/g.72835  ORF Transcript_41473/g.72835 Transcript_41473/m.72835 type:complete len:177 (+) Transcript_41473:145-675(+)